MNYRLVMFMIIIFGLSHPGAFASGKDAFSENVLSDEALRQMIKGMTIKAYLDLALRNESTEKNGRELLNQVGEVDVDFLMSGLNRRNKDFADSVEGVKSLLVTQYGYSRKDFENSDQFRLSPFRSDSRQLDSRQSNSSSPGRGSESPATVSSSDNSSGKYSLLSRFSPIRIKKLNTYR